MNAKSEATIWPQVFALFFHVTEYFYVAISKSLKGAFTHAT
jgi:hypothetical protein